ncbi:MAG: hypothetical protein JXR96_10130 [Deltaproteobacteria bacterium]|nr:hypothetical protein [Deltaproteobacteria bacterium]
MSDSKTRIRIWIIAGISIAALGSAAIAILLVWDGQDCVRAGCSGELCISKAEARQGRGRTTCRWVGIYRCYKLARCERQPDGRCGFTMTEEARKCLGPAHADPVGRSGERR